MARAKMPGGAPLGGAVRAAPGGILLDLEVHPAASSAAFPDGVNPWRGRIGARVVAPAKDGRANSELVSLVARFFEVPAASVRLRAGATDRRKTLAVAGISVAEARRRLEGAR